MQDNPSAYSAREYDRHIASVLPFYGEYHHQVIDLVQSIGNPNPLWLDTGCGTGTLAARALETLPGARFTLCDPSEQMLRQAEEKLRGQEVQFLMLSSQQIFFRGRFDVVTAIQCHHYLRPAERERAVRACYHALKPGGVFVTFEHIRMSSPESDAIALLRWADYLKAHGCSDEEVQTQLDRRGREVLPITGEEHLALLRSCGFRAADVLWASYLQAGFWAIR